MSDNDLILKAMGINKSFGAVVAANDINIDIKNNSKKDK